MRELLPQQVGDFKLQGEVKPVGIAPLNNYESGALRPTEGLTAQYEAPGGARVILQVLNYPSAADSGRALKQIEENVRNLSNGAKLSEDTRAGDGQKAASRKIVVEGIAPGFDEVIWVDDSVLYQVSGDKLNAVLEFERKLP